MIHCRFSFLDYYRCTGILHAQPADSTLDCSRRQERSRSFGCLTGAQSDPRKNWDEVSSPPPPPPTPRGGHHSSRPASPPPTPASGTRRRALPLATTPDPPERPRPGERCAGATAPPPVLSTCMILSQDQTAARGPHEDHAARDRAGNGPGSDIGRPQGRLCAWGRAPGPFPLLRAAVRTSAGPPQPAQRTRPCRVFAGAALRGAFGSGLPMDSDSATRRACRAAAGAQGWPSRAESRGLATRDLRLG